MVSKIGAVVRLMRENFLAFLVDTSFFGVMDCVIYGSMEGLISDVSATGNSYSLLRELNDFLQKQYRDGHFEAFSVN